MSEDSFRALNEWRIKMETQQQETSKDIAVMKQSLIDLKEMIGGKFEENDKKHISFEATISWQSKLIWSACGGVAVVSMVFIPIGRDYLSYSMKGQAQVASVQSSLETLKADLAKHEKADKI